MRSGICSESNIKLIFSICKWNSLIGAIGMLVLSHHLYSLCCMSYIQMILSFNVIHVEYTIKDNTCFHMKPNVLVSVYYYCVHWDWGRQWALLSHCDRHCEMIWITCVGLLLSKRECMSVDRWTEVISRHKVTCLRYMISMPHICIYEVKTIPDTKGGKIFSTDRYHNRLFLTSLNKTREIL